MVDALGRRHWIPPVALVAGQLAHGASWILLLVLALHRPIALGAPALGWLHLVALGWLTMTALTILVHVIPGFIDATWRGERIARGALFVFEAAVIVLVCAFWTGATAALPWAGTLIVLALALYLLPASRTLVTAFAGYCGAERSRPSSARRTGAIGISSTFYRVTRSAISRPSTEAARSRVSR